MSLWVKLHGGFFTHRKTIRLRSVIGEAALWIPPRLWCYAAENQPDGDFSRYTTEEVALAIGYLGDASSMLQALLQAGFLDPDPLRIHGWQEHNAYHGTFAERAKKAANARWSRQGASSPTPSPERRGEEKRRASIAQASPSIPSSIASSIAQGEAVKASPTGDGKKTVSYLNTFYHAQNNPG